MGGEDLTLDEVASAGERIVDKVPDTGRVIWGARVGSSLTGRVRVMAVLIEIISTFIEGKSQTPAIFVNEKGEQLSLEWFNDRINHFQKSKNITQMEEP